MLTFIQDDSKQTFALKKCKTKCLDVRQVCFYLANNEKIGDGRGERKKRKVPISYKWWKVLRVCTMHGHVYDMQSLCEIPPSVVMRFQRRVCRVNFVPIIGLCQEAGSRGFCQYFNFDAIPWVNICLPVQKQIHCHSAIQQNQL